MLIEWNGVRVEAESYAPASGRTILGSVRVVGILLALPFAFAAALAALAVGGVFAAVRWV